MSQTRPIDEHSMHTRTCGELRRENVGEEVTLTGWVSRRRDHGGLIFCDLRDREGITQLTFDPEHSDGDAFKIAETMRPEWPIKIHGVVRARGDETTNTKLATGEIEVLTDHAEVLNTSVTPPFQIEDGIETSEDTRLRYRYLDLRRPEMMANLKLRSDFTFAIREALHNREFMEVETPSLFKSTPEGARDFIVPSRIQPGNFYALPQSPQLLKQLLMVSGVERYYQLARCYRDEDFRADRQPEFTQLDMEMAYVDQEDVMAMTEKVIAAIWKSAGYEVQLPLPRITWKDAMDKYGSDKPDLRFGNPLVELTEYFKNTPFRVFQAPYVGAVVFKGGAATPRRQFDAWQDWARQRGAKGLAYVVFGENGELKGPVPRTYPMRSATAYARPSVPRKATPCSSPPVPASQPSCCWVPCVWSSPPAKACWIRRSSLSLGSWTSRCSSPPTIRMMTMWLSATPSGPPCTTRSPCLPRIGSTSSTRIPSTPCPTPTTSSATVRRWAAVPYVSTATTSKPVCSMCWASPRKRPTRSSASCLRHSSTALRLTRVWPSVGTAPCPSWPVQTPSATSSPSRRPAAAATR